MPNLDAFYAVARVGLAILVNGLWQGALIAFVAWAALAIFRGANATTRYAVWTLALLAVFVVPIATSLSRVSVETQAAPAVTHVSAPLSSNHVAAPVRQSVAAPAGKVAVAATSASDRAGAPVFSAPAVHLNVPDLALAIPFGLWLLAALAIVVRLTISFAHLERLKHDSLPLSVEYRDEMPRWMNAIKGSRDVRICISDEIEVPVAVGLFDSMILLPSSLIQTLAPAEIDQISLHELGHLLRSDDWTNALQRIVSALLFFNPAVWFISRQMDVEREVACDDYVLQLTGAVRPYAFCLTKMAEMTSWPHRPLPAPGVFVTRKNISIRIERLLRSGRAIGSGIAPAVAATAVVGLLAIFFVLRTMTPTLAFTEPCPTVAQALPFPAALPTAPEIPHPVAKKAALPLPAVPHIAPAPHVVIKKVAVDLPSEKQIEAQVMRQVDASVAQLRGNDREGCGGCNFANAAMNGHDFSNRDLSGSNFERAALRDARFTSADLTGANFRDADLRGVSFRNANLEGCNLRGARLAGADFSGASLTGCNVDASALSPQQAREFLTRCEGCNMSDADLRGMDLHGIDVTGLNMANADLRGANLSGAKFTGVNFGGAKMNGANVDRADFTGCNFGGVDLRGVDFSHASMTASNMSGAIWR